MEPTILIAIGAGAFHGINEGMDMHQPNVREHKWFWAYHRLYVLEAALLIWFGYRLYLGLWLISAALLANRAMEMVYGWTRYRELFPDYENILGLGIVVTGSYAKLWQFALLFTGLYMAFIF